MSVQTSQLALPGAPGVDTKQEQIKAWALVELLGRQRIVGYVSEQAFGTGILFRVDVPDLLKGAKVIRKGFTRFFGLSSIYSIPPIDEEVVRELLPSIDCTPAARPLSQGSYLRERDDY